MRTDFYITENLSKEAALKTIDAARERNPNGVFMIHAHVYGEACNDQCETV